MKIVNAGYELITPINGKIILERIEQIARVCYKSELKAKEGSAEKNGCGFDKERTRSNVRAL